MRTVTLTTKEFETIPGYSTEIDAETWKGKVDTLLYRLAKNPKAKILRKAWITEGEGDETQDTLLLEVKVSVGNIERHMNFRLEPVMIKRKIEAHGRIRYKVEEGASWKLFYDLLNQKIAAARVGVSELQYEFMPYIAKRLPDGREGTLADIMDIALKADRLNELGALEDQTRAREDAMETKRAIAADYKVHQEAPS